MTVIRVLLADDEALVLTALAGLIGFEDDIEVVAQAQTGMAAVEAARQHRPDVAVLDLQMPVLNGVEVAERLTEELLGCGCIIVTSHGRPGYLNNALEAGVRGFLPKSAPAEAFIEAVRIVCSGGRYIDPDLAAEAISVGENPLTPREAEVLSYAADGSTVREIADRVHLSHGTVRNYLSSVQTKLDATNRHEAASKARAHGWI